MIVIFFSRKKNLLQRHLMVVSCATLFVISCLVHSSSSIRHPLAEMNNDFDEDEFSAKPGLVVQAFLGISSLLLVKKKEGSFLITFV